MSPSMNEVIWANSSFASNQQYVALIQDLIDIAAPRTNLTLNPGGDSVGFHCPVGCRHWSRSFEWPWALVQADLRSRDVVLEAGGGDTELQFLLARHSR